jgi:hypothetical protein
MARYLLISFSPMAAVARHGLGCRAERGERDYHVMVRAYLSEDMTKRARADTQYQGQTVLGYVSDLLAQGWTPDQGGELAITIQNPTGEKEDAASKPWWRFW